MNQNNSYCVIMAGGYGQRLWPVSRTGRPKQFLDLAFLGKSMIRHTYERFLNFIPAENIIVVTSTKFADAVHGQIPELPAENLLLEPYMRNTAPCIAYATYTILQRNPDANIIFSPSDNYISDPEVFKRLAARALEFVEGADVLITLGIVPSRPDTNYGYIQVAGGKGNISIGSPVKVKTFTEKPDASLAKVFVDSGEFLWNSGMFVSHAAGLKDEMETYNPEVTALFRGWDKNIGTPSEKSFIEKAYTDCPWTSFDYGLLERTDNAWIMPCDFNWIDIGNWASVYDYTPGKDADGNVTYDNPHLFQDCSEVMAFSTDRSKLLAIKGLDDYIVVDTPDALLICPKSDSDVKSILSGLAMPEYEKFR